MKNKYFEIDYYYDNGSTSIAQGYSVIIAKNDKEAITILKKENKITLINSLHEITRKNYIQRNKLAANHKRWNSYLKIIY